MNLQLLPEIALLTVPNFRGYFYRKYLCQYYISERLFPKKKGHASTDFCRSYVRKPSQWHAWPEQKIVMGLEKEEPSSSPIIAKHLLAKHSAASAGDEGAPGDTDPLFVI
jgi:hypothetical protein